MNAWTPISLDKWLALPCLAVTCPFQFVLYDYDYKYDYDLVVFSDQNHSRSPQHCRLAGVERRMWPAQRRAEHCFSSVKSTVQCARFTLPPATPPHFANMRVHCFIEVFAELESAGSSGSWGSSETVNDADLVDRAPFPNIQVKHNRFENVSYFGQCLTSNANFLCTFF